MSAFNTAGYLIGTFACSASVVCYVIFGNPHFLGLAIFAAFLAAWIMMLEVTGK